MPIDADLLRKIAPQPRTRAQQAAVLAVIGPVLAATLKEFAIDTDLRAAHFLAQVGEESWGYACLVEESDGSFYEGSERLGNTEPGDGRRYIGRGLIQLTGRSNYTHFSRPGLDLVNHPELAAEPKIALELACAFWNDRKLSPLADCDDVLTITHRINGGFTGYASRCEYLARAKTALGIRQGDIPVAPLPVLREGDSGTEVMRMQARLARRGYAVGVDGNFGPNTAAELERFEGDNGLQPDGVAGPEVWAKLMEVR